MAIESVSNRFVAIDVETANARLASICQIGVATFENGVLSEAWGVLVNPEDYFDSINVSIHGIDEKRTNGASPFPGVFQEVANRLRNHVVVSHTAFDRAALGQSCNRYVLPAIECAWLDSARVVRRTWDRFAKQGYGLRNVCASLGISYRAHDAVEDARAAGEVLIRAMQETGLNISDWQRRVLQPIDQSGVRISMEGDPDGPLYGEEVVFTGALSISRREAAVAAARVGCCVAAGVTKSTSILVVGDQDIDRLAGHEKSAKHRKAEDLIAKGHNIRIVREADFLRLM